MPFTLGERPNVAIRIFAMDVPGRGSVLVRRITEGYTSIVCPHGKYEGSAASQGTEKLIATGAYWSGLWDHDDGENETDGTNVNVDPDEYGESYRAYLELDGVPLTDESEYVDFTKDA